MDAYDFSKPEDILSSLNKEFWDGVCAAKWQERRDSLHTLKQLASAPRLGTGDYADIVRELRKVRPRIPRPRTALEGQGLAHEPEASCVLCR